MYLLEEIKRIMSKKNVKNAMIFVDMDGVIADYRFGEGDNIKSKYNINIISSNSCLFEKIKNDIK